MLHAELFELLPPDRKITMRYPGAKFESVLHRDCNNDNLNCGGEDNAVAAALAAAARLCARADVSPAGYGALVPSGVLPPPDPAMAFGVATAANFKENTGVARLGYDNDYFMCDQTGGGTYIGGAQHDGDVPRTTRLLPNGQDDPRDGPNGQIPAQDSLGDPVFNSVHGLMLGPGYACCCACCCSCCSCCCSCGCFCRSYD